MIPADPILDLIVRSRWFGALLLAGFASMLVGVLLALGGHLPPRQTLPTGIATGSDLVPVEKAQAAFALEGVRRSHGLTNPVSPFYTAFFQPAANPAPAPPPTTRKVGLTYLGYVESSSGRKQAYVKLDERMFIGPAGSNVVGTFAIADIAMRALLLKDAQGQTNLLQFNLRKEIEIPVK